MEYEGNTGGQLRESEHMGDVQVDGHRENTGTEGSRDGTEEERKSDKHGSMSEGEESGIGHSEGNEENQLQDVTFEQVPL